jgi:glycine betaine/proline transport system substrate-binding protein
VINPELNTKAPAVVAFLKKLSWKPEEIGAVMLAVEGGAKPEAAAEKWIADNPARVAGWLA